MSLSPSGLLTLRFLSLCGLFLRPRLQQQSKAPISNNPATPAPAPIPIISCFDNPSCCGDDEAEVAAAESEATVWLFGVVARVTETRLVSVSTTVLLRTSVEV
jgi:hypothetical protein